MTHWGQQDRSRRQVVSALSGLGIGFVRGRRTLAQDAPASATPDASTEGGEWTFTDVLGNTVTLPHRPARIAANLVTAAALWDLGIRPVAVFDFTATAYPNGDHVAWGNVDPAAVAIVSDASGNILVEDLLTTQPDVILTLTFDSTDASGTASVPPDLAEQIGRIAPVLVVTDMASTEVQLARLIELAVRLGANVDAPTIVKAKAAYEAKVIEFRAAAAKVDVTSLFMNFDADAIYAAGPGGVAELRFLDSLGLRFANAGSAEADEFWETLSPEQALKYPSDIVYNDVYSAYQGVEQLQAHPVYGAMPAVAAGQVGSWERDFPVNYAGMTTFLEVILASLRAARSVTG